MDVTVSDVIGTAHTNAALSISKLNTLRSVELPRWKIMAGLEEIEHLLAKAMSDVLLAQHMLSSDWVNTTYVGAKR